MGTNLQRNSDLKHFSKESNLKGFSKEPVQSFSSHWEMSHPFHLASDQTPEKPEVNRTYILGKGSELRTPLAANQ